jgi:NAD(P)H-dependent FMN reductase
MKEFGEAEVEYCVLEEAALHLCRRCYACISRGEEYCPFQDERAAIEERMLDADGVIFAAPNAVSNIPWLMKNFMDRFAYRCHRPAFYGKSAIVVVTSAGSFGLGNALENLSSGPASWGFEVVFRLGVPVYPGVPAKSGLTEKNEHQVEEAARTFSEALSSPHQMAPEFWRIMQFHAMKANALLFPDQYPADYAYYKERSFFTDVRIGAAKRLLGRITGYLIRRSIAKECRAR